MSSAPVAATIASDSKQTSANAVCAATIAQAQATPSMRQYFEVKARHPECLLFYRMGDFYELFFEDATIAASILDIALTKRGKHEGDAIPMCGVPVHAAESYLLKLIESGHKIAICEQLETPEEAKKRGYKAIVKRDVVRIVTPGTITEETLLAPTQAQYLAAIVFSSRAVIPGLPEAEPGISRNALSKLQGISAQGRDDASTSAALARLDLTTGEFITTTLEVTQLSAALARIQPKEILLTQAAWEYLSPQSWFVDWKARVSIRPDVAFGAKEGERRLRTHFNVASTQGFGEFSAGEIAAAGAVLDYVSLTQLEAHARLDTPQREQAGNHLQMDAATRRNLEITETLNGTRRGSLLHTIDTTQTAAGSRLLASWLTSPLAERDALIARQDSVAWMIDNAKHADECRSMLKAIADMERAVGRLALGRGGPRDLLLLAVSLTQTDALHETLRTLGLPALLDNARNALASHHALAENLTVALKSEVGMFVRDGNFIADGYRADLDEYRRLRDESKRVIAGMESELKAQTGIPSLKIKHNNVLGYFIEITAIHEKKIPADFIHRQGLSGVMRYTNAALSDTARRIEEAADKALKLELQLFEELRNDTLARGKEIVAAARAIALFDVVSSLADLASRENWVRPHLTEDSAFVVEGGRHPVVESALRRANQEFTSNDCEMGVTRIESRELSEKYYANHLAQVAHYTPNSPLEGESAHGFRAPVGGESVQDTPLGFANANPAPPQGGGRNTARLSTLDSQLLLITGPNMGGKSTYLRQQAILTILAQMGSYVPAKSATIGLVDKLFCRVGAADDLARGQSTFMVEMVETASILNQATARSLVVLDEIGRGTATYDGVSIAWAVAEFLHDSVQCRALFATHYHELTALAETLPRLKNLHVEVKEYQGRLIFLHTLRAGAADKSYGIHVAALAGLPKPVLTRARALLQQLESGQSIARQKPTAQRSLFDTAPEEHEPKKNAPSTAVSPLSSAQQELLGAITSLDVNQLSPLEALNLLHAWKGKLTE